MRFTLLPKRTLLRKWLAAGLSAVVGGMAAAAAQGTDGTNGARTNITHAASVATSAKQTNAVSPLSFESFRVIAERNVFDPNRSSRSSRSNGGEPTRVPKVDIFGLVGIIQYSKGVFAFFDSSNSDYRKTAKVGDTVGGHEIKMILPSEVQMEASGAKVALKVGQQLRREEGGPWQTSAQTGGFTPEPSSGSPETAAAAGSAAQSSGAGNDVLTRLLKKREKENR